MMAKYRFFAATATNEARSGIIEAEDLQAALSILRGRGLIVIRISKPPRLSSLWAGLNREIALRPPLTAKELARFSQEWGGLVEAGVSVEESLALLGRASSSSTRQVLFAIREAVKAGVPLHEALGQFPDTFPSVYRALIQAGEAAGNLGSAIRQLGDRLMYRRGLTEDIRNALLYPLFLFITANAGILVLLLVVVPNLESLIGEGGEERLPAVTRHVLVVSHVLRDHGLALLSASIVSALAAAFYMLSPAGRIRVDAIILRIPILGPLVRGIQTGRFSRTLGGLLNGGVSISTAMPIAVQTVANREMRRGLEAAHSSIMSGAAIGNAIGATNVFQEDAIGLIRVGESTGRLAAALERAGDLYEARTTRQLKALTAMLTPVMTIGFGAIAGVIVYAMLSTILGINELAGR